MNSPQIPGTNHPGAGAWSSNIHDLFRSIAYHELRHAKQIREVVEISHQ
jgi:hypothetical protein